MRISKLYIDKSVIDSPTTRLIRSRLNDIAVTEVENADQVYREVTNAGSDPILHGKKNLYLTKNRGAFVKECPGTRTYTCCGYKILHIGTYCTMDCAYCILQAYFHPPVLQFFVNHTDLSRELDDLFALPEIQRIGTGEFTDSMLWEDLADLSEFLVPKFAAQTRAVLELKTKTTHIDKLKNLHHNRKTIISWSLNTQNVIGREELRTASLAARLEAAARCESWGYPLAFHFDPMVIYEGCETDYRSAVRQLFSRVSPENIVWISLGSFRFIPSLKPIIQQRFKQSKIIYGEFITGLDGKMRYFKPLRIALYRRMAQWIREIAPHVLIYFCMEDDEVWQKSLGFLPETRGGLSKMLDESAMAHCGLMS